MLTPRSPSCTRLVLVRHGEPEDWAMGRCCGRADPALSPVGVAQALDVARGLASLRVEAIFSSPSQRAVATAVPCATDLNLPPSLLPDLMEIDFGRMEALTFDEAILCFPNVCRTWVERPWEVSFPAGESCAALRDRVRAARRHITGQHSGHVVALFSHGGPIRVMVGDALGLPSEGIFHIEQRYGGITIIDYEMNDRDRGTVQLHDADPGCWSLSR
ncbi:MAG: histidine phosphatase family protein [Polyangia bacterium]